MVRILRGFVGCRYWREL